MGVGVFWPDGDDRRAQEAFRPSTGLGVTPVRMDFEVVERSAPHRLRLKGAGGGPEYALRVDVELELFLVSR